MYRIPCPKVKDTCDVRKAHKDKKERCDTPTLKNNVLTNYNIILLFINLFVAFTLFIVIVLMSQMNTERVNKCTTGHP